jgi:hypothetical protein
MNITDNDSDYLWYSFKTKPSAAGAASSTSDEAEGRREGGDGGVPVKVAAVGGTMTYVYIDGILQQHPPIVVQTGQQRRASQQVDVLSVAMGMYNGGVGPNSVKGVTSVTVGKETYTHFQTAGHNFSSPNSPASSFWAVVKVELFVVCRLWCVTVA